VDNPALLSVRVSNPDGEGLVVVALDGELDFTTCAQLEDSVSPLLAAGRRVVVDMTELRLCDSSGIGTLLRLHKITKAGSGRMRLTHLQPHVEAAIRVTSPDRWLKLHDGA
jgi:anti-sigma B factor antagonist